jgi:WD40 repeat protein
VGETGVELGRRNLCEAAWIRCLSFTHSGDALWVGGYVKTPASGDSFSHLVDLQGNLLSRLFGCDTDIALHPEGELFASFVSDQGATLLRFARAADGRGHGGLEMFDTALIIDVDGYEGLVFSPSGDRFAMMGNAYEVFAVVHSFPSLKRELVLPVADWNDLHRHLPPPWNDYRWSLMERVAFSPDGQSLLLGNFAGDVGVVTLGVEPRLEQTWKTHDGPIGALRTRPHDGMLVTTDLHGHLRLFRMPKPFHAPDTANRPLTRAYLQGSRAVPLDTDMEGLALTDGIRTWDLGRLGEEPLPDDAPAWARLGAALRGVVRGREES